MKVAVVGGGVIGVSTARQLARAGAKVILLTESVLTSEASGRSLSWLNSAAMWSEPYHRLRMAGIDRYRRVSMLGGFHVVVPILCQIPVTAVRLRYATLA